MKTAKEERTEISRIKDKLGFMTCAKCGRVHGLRVLRCWRCGYAKEVKAK